MIKKPQTIQLEHGQKDVSRHFTKEDIQMLYKHIENSVQHHWPLGKGKLKPQ